MSSSGDNLNFSDWMSQLPKELQTVPLSHIAIPGSHDSTTAKLSENEIGPDTSPQVATCVKLLHKEHLLYQWSKTQQMNITQQLMAGLRYFDLRICKEKENYYFTHGLLSGQVSDFLAEIKSFLGDHKKEIVILDTNHFYSMDQEEDHNALIRLFMETLGRSMLCLYVGVDEVTLENLWNNDQQILLFYHHPIAEDHPELWPGDVMVSNYANSDHPEQVMSFLEQEMEKGRPNKQFFVFQGVLTPKLENIVKAFFNKDTLESLSSQISKPFITWLSKQKIGPQGINITIIDYAEKDDYIPAVIGLNKVENLQQGANDTTVDEHENTDDLR